MKSDAAWLAREELRRSKFSIAFTAVFFLIYGGITGFITGEIPAEELQGESAESMKFVVDFILLALISCIGFGMSKGYLSTPYWRTDYFTVRLSILRSLPIPVHTVVKQRLLQMVFYTAMSVICFFAIFYTVSGWSRDTFSLPEYLLFVLCWASYGFTAGILFLCLEWGGSGKRYLALSFVALLILIAVVALIYFIAGIHITFWLAETITGPIGWAFTLLCMVVAACTVRFGYKRLLYIVQNRDFR
ncbi:hypothetical protein [Paenibacillus thermotolerans]|uniref:hypothetical protein n=1 Tax=Paenibacillus thermotolerans TaxID=3027807 RepID=UPI00236887B2|nr:MULTISPECIES: hypothetical protein [unclassified Paenibacillus]